MKSESRTRKLQMCSKSLLAAAIAFAVLLLIFPSVLLAEPVTAAQAAKAVEGWLKIDSELLGSTLGRQIEQVTTYTDDDAEPIYYVVYLRPSGFVIVPADDLVEPIICFLSSGTYDPSPDNCLGALVSRDLPARIAAVRGLQAQNAHGEEKEPAAWQSAIQKASAGAKSKWARLQTYAYLPDEQTVKSGLSGVSDVRVPPIVQSEWSQSYVCGNLMCYNYYTPENYVCGCVATAMAQIMRFHQYPTSGIGVDDYPITIVYEENPDEVIYETAYTRGGNGSGGPYYWDQMVLVPNSVCGSLTLTQRQAIGALCYDAGVTVSMNYTFSGSGAYSYKVRDALIDPFLYSRAIYAYSSTSSIPEANLNNMANTNLDANHPVYLGIYQDYFPYYGHAIVCDGYGYNLSTLYHHLNMGWSGYDDAWYDLPDIDCPPYFNVVDECIYNIFTSGTGEIISGRVTNTSGNPLDGAGVTALRSGGGTYNATTNSRGIYALAKVPSASTYNISVAKVGYAFVGRQVTTGTSTNDSTITGNRWAINFVGTPAGPAPPIAENQTVSVQQGVPKTIDLQAEDDGEPDPPAALTYIIVSLPVYGTLEDPAAGQINIGDLPYTLAANGNQVKYTQNPCYSASSVFDFKVNDGGTPPEGGDSNIATVTANVQSSGSMVVFETDFESGIPAGWTIVDGGSSTDTWELTADPPKSNENWDGTIMIVDSYHAYTVEMDEQLITHSIDCSEYDSVILAFTHWFRYYSGNQSEICDVDIRVDGGSWQNVVRYDFDAEGLVELDLSGWAAGQSDVQIRWHYYNAWYEFYWGIDNVEITVNEPSYQIPGDITPDCGVDMVDFAVFAEAWFSGPGDGNWNPDCDISEPADDFIDALDLGVLAENWLEGIL